MNEEKRRRDLDVDDDEALFPLGGKQLAAGMAGVGGLAQRALCRFLDFPAHKQAMRGKRSLKKFYP